MNFAALKKLVADGLAARGGDGSDTPLNVTASFAIWAALAWWILHTPKASLLTGAAAAALAFSRSDKGGGD